MTGYTLGEAITILDAAGVKEIKVLLTSPPRSMGEEYSHRSRVVRQRSSSDETVQELVVCNFNH